MRLLFVGDLVGPEASYTLRDGLPGLRRRLDIDLVVVNAENTGHTAADPGQGFGMPGELVDALFEGGVDVVTSGNHGFDAPDAGEVHGRERVLRPINLPAAFAGTGSVTLDVAGEAVTIVNVISPTAMDEATPLEQVPDLVPDTGTVIIDLHADGAWEKFVFATAMDGRVAAVLGTHEHDATEPLYILPQGTAFVADVGMTGPSGLPGGFPLAHFAARYTGVDRSALPPYQLATGPFVLGAVLLDIEAGRTTAIERVRAEQLGGRE